MSIYCSLLLPSSYKIFTTQAIFSDAGLVEVCNRYIQPAVSFTFISTDGGKPFCFETATTDLRLFFSASITLNLIPSNVCSPVGRLRKSSPSLFAFIHARALLLPLLQLSILA